ncbi:hypothetical protein K439DRAFT_703122 [Ramaria rubella]|nr:hypothetical protein K439DRAFT_703122 [Ramaria rubella]
MHLPIDYQKLPPIFSAAEAAKNCLQLVITSIPDVILYMAFNKVYIPLSLLTTAALNKIRCNDDLKYKKILFGNGAWKPSLDEAQFPPETSLTSFLFLQAYRNWLTVIDAICDAQLAVGWHEHYKKMLGDGDFENCFHAWQDHDKHIRSQFMTKPFLVDPKHTTYLQLFEHYRTSLMLSRLHTESPFHSIGGGGSRIRNIPSSSASSRFAP